MRDLFCSIPGTRGRTFLRSLERWVLFLQYARTSTSRTSRAFSVVSLSLWNGLPLTQRASWLIRTQSTITLKLFFFIRAVLGPGALLALRRRHISRCSFRKITYERHKKVCGTKNKIIVPVRHVLKVSKRRVDYYLARVTTSTD